MTTEVVELDMGAVDDELVARAVAAARTVEQGGMPSASYLSMLKAIASTRAEKDRHALARRAEANAGEIGAAALRVLRVVIFGLAP